MRIWRPVPAADNNDTEIAAVLAAVKWAARKLDPSRSIYVYTDSTYTRNVLLGVHQAKTPAAIKLSRLWKQTHKHLSAHHSSLCCVHVRRHGITKWNAEADRLADKGRTGNAGISKSKYDCITPSNIISEFHPGPMASAVGETLRIQRALHAFGQLHIPLQKQRLYMPGEIQAAHEDCLHRIQQQRTSLENKNIAIDIINAARDLLTDQQQQAQYACWLRSDIERTAPTQYSIKCPIDVHALEEFSQTPAADEVPSNQSLSYRTLIHNYLALVTTYGAGNKRRGHVLLYYRHTGAGAEMVAAGIISRARVYAGRHHKTLFTSLRGSGF